MTVAGGIQVDDEARLGLALGKPVAAAPDAMLAVDHDATAPALQLHGKLHGKPACRHVRTRWQQGECACDAGRFIAAHAFLQPGDGDPCHAEHGLGILPRKRFIGLAVQPQQFGVAQRAGRVLAAFAGDQADLANAVASGHQAHPLGGAGKHTQAAADDQVERVRGVAPPEQRAAAGQ